MVAGNEPAPGQQLEYRESIERLRRAILSLRGEEKEVFLLRQNGDLTYEQIAEMRHVPVGTVKTQMRTALIKLRRVLNPTGTAEPRGTCPPAAGSICCGRLSNKLGRVATNSARPAKSAHGQRRPR